MSTTAGDLTLRSIVDLLASAPDLDRLLAGVVELLTEATDCHACFIYLRNGDELRIRAASEVYSHAVGRVAFGVGEGLTGWVAQHGRAAFIRDGLLDDPRTNYVPELEEERFQSMVAVPVTARSGRVLGVVVLHTVAPRTFEQDDLDFLSRTAALVAGPIETARLLADSRRRVAELTAVASLSERIAAETGRAELHAVVVGGLRELLGCESVELHLVDEDRGRLELVAADPPLPASASSPTVLLDAPVAVQLTAGDRRLGVLAAHGRGARPEEDTDWLLRAVATQVALALSKAELIERLTEENLVRDLFAAFAEGRAGELDARLRAVGLDPTRTSMVVHVQPARGRRGEVTGWAERAEARLRRVAPGTLCHPVDDRLEALLPVVGPVVMIDDALRAVAAEFDVAIGRSEPRPLAKAASSAREAATAVAAALARGSHGVALAFEELGADRFLVHACAAVEPSDPLLVAVRALSDYDLRRGTQLVPTLEQVLADRGRHAASARALHVHPNTLRQRLDRIAQITDLDLETTDLLALEVALRLARLGAG